ncbi:MAG: glycosyltransferase family 2 protein, partial [Methylobacter sp.]|nr:glycosyltransferase family 2 protein [Methylobacter sp.]
MSTTLQNLSTIIQSHWHEFVSLWAPLDGSIEGFIYYYPLFMAYVWMFGAIIFYFRHEWRQQGNAEHLPELKDYPPVSILIPCYNEGENVRETVEILMRQKYPNFEIIAVNDGSKDDTLSILQELAEQHPKLRVVNLHTNQGKAMGLRSAALLANSEILICIDGDALLAP